MLVMALVAVIAAEMLRRGNYLRTSFSGQLLARQSWHYALGGEAFARQLLARDHQLDDGRDTLDDGWAQTEDAAPFAIDGGAMKIEILDLQGRFNLNNVIDDEGRPRGEGLVQWRNLLQALGLNGRYAAEWLDWLDADQQRSPDGAEDSDYSSYRTAGGFEADASALLLLRSMRAEDYTRLEPLVATLPATTPLNVNTASAEALRSLSPAISAARAGQLVARQQSGGFDSLEQFRQQAGVSSEAVPDALIALASNYFEVRVVVQHAGRWQRLRSVLHRSDTGALSVISRQRLIPRADEQER